MLPKILLVEDDEVIREIYAMKFELEGFPVATAENGEIALGVLDEFNPDIILLDMMMPVMGGVEFLQHLAGSPHRHADDIIIFSNMSATNHMNAVAGYGIQDYWLKSDYTPERVVTELTRRWNSRSGAAS